MRLLFEILKVLAVLALGAVVIMLVACVQAREAAYYAPPKPKVCEIPVWDGPAEDGKLLYCVSRASWRETQ